MLLLSVPSQPPDLTVPTAAFLALPCSAPSKADTVDKDGLPALQNFQVQNLRKCHIRTPQYCNTHRGLLGCTGGLLGCLSGGTAAELLEEGLHLQIETKRVKTCDHD